MSNFIFLSVGLIVGTMFGCVLGENSEKDKRIQDMRRRFEEIKPITLSEVDIPKEESDK